MKKDVAGNELVVGDKVAYCVVNYSHLLVGTIIKFTPKRITLLLNKRGDTLSRASNQVCKISS